MIGVVVLTYNTWDATVECIQSFYSFHDKNSFRMYVVDNASTVKVTEECKEVIQNYGVYFIKSPNNRGYAAGNNVGIKAALSDECSHVLISNNDIVYTENILEKLDDDYNKYHNAAIIAPKIVLSTGEIQETNLGCEMTLKGKYLYILRKTPLKRLSRKFVSRFHIDMSSKYEVFQLHGVSGCCFMITSSALEEINLFDEHTFLFEEENILSAQIAKIKKDILIDPQIQVTHRHGFTTKNIKAVALKAHTESEIYYCKRYLLSRNVSILPLVMIRVAEYCRNLSKDEYRREFRTFIKGIRKELSCRYR